MGLILIIKYPENLHITQGFNNILVKINGNTWKVKLILHIQN